MTEISSKMIAPCIPVESFKQHEALWGKALLLVGGSVMGRLWYRVDHWPRWKESTKPIIKLISKHHVCLSQPAAAKTRSTGTAHSSFWKPRSPRSGAGQFCSQMKALFLSVGSHLLTVPSEGGERGMKSSDISSISSMIPSGHMSPTLVTSSKPHHLPKAQLPLPKGGKPSFPYPSELLDEAFVRKHRLTREKQKFINMYAPCIHGRKMSYSPRWPRIQN